MQIHMTPKTNGRKCREFPELGREKIKAIESRVISDLKRVLVLKRPRAGIEVFLSSQTLSCLSDKAKKQGELLQHRDAPGLQE